MCYSFGSAFEEIKTTGCRGRERWRGGGERTTHVTAITVANPLRGRRWFVVSAPTGWPATISRVVRVVTEQSGRCSSGRADQIAGVGLA